MLLKSKKTLIAVSCCGAVALIIGCVILALYLTGHFEPEPTCDQGRFEDTSSKVLASTPIPDFNASFKVFVVYGQSNSANHGELLRIPTGTNLSERLPYRVFQYFQRNVYAFSDNEPILGATGEGGNVWGRVGLQLLLADSTTDFVVFGAAGWGGQTIEALSDPDFCLYPFFLETYLSMLNKFGNVDAVLFHQGESDVGRGAEYKKTFEELDRALTSSLPSNASRPKWFVSQTSYCGGNQDAQVRAAQIALVDNLPNFCRGPNTDELVGNVCGVNQSSQCRYDDCHFSLEGLNTFAELWTHALLNEQC